MRKNLFALYGVQIASLLLPLLTIPFLARILGPSALGELAAIQSLFATLGFIIEYGFNFSAVSQVAIYRDDRVKLTQIFADITGAKIILSAIFTIISLLVYIFVPVYREIPILFWLGFCSGIIQGFNLIWFYQGLEKISFAAAIDIALRLVNFFIIIFLIKSSEDLSIVLLSQTVTTLAALIINALMARKHLNKLFINIQGSLKALKDGSGMFFFRSLTLVRTTASSAILRVFLPSASVAYYANAERLTNVSYTAFLPLNQIFFPKISHAVHHNFEAAKSLFRKYLLIIFSMSIISAIIAYFAAPFAVEVIFGSEYKQAVDIFRILLLTIPIVSINTLFGIQWLAINGMQKQLNTATSISTIICVACIIIFVPTYKLKGMAWIIVFCELITMSIVTFCSIRHPNNPFSKKPTVH